MRCVVDASVAVKWYIGEPLHLHAEKLLDGSWTLHAPELIIPEFGNIIWKKVSRGEITQSEGRSIVAAFSKQNLYLSRQRRILNPAYFGAELSGQTVYDWTYMALAVGLSCEFVTADARFYKSLEKTSMAKFLKWVGDL